MKIEFEWNDGLRWKNAKFWFQKNFKQKNLNDERIKLSIHCKYVHPFIFWLRFSIIIYGLIYDFSKNCVLTKNVVYNTNRKFIKLLTGMLGHIWAIFLIVERWGQCNTFFVKLLIKLNKILNNICHSFL